MSSVPLRVLRSLALFALLLAFALPSVAQNDPTKRLVLKDGSYQSVVKWEVKGDRVRYLSAERFEWEEVPGSLVDWDATNKYAEDLKKGVSHSAADVDKEVEAERKEMDARSPEVAPGLRLPDTGGVFLFETFAQLPQLVELAQNGSDINRNTGTNILRATVNPLASAKQTIELPGLHAAVQAHGGRPAIYVSAADEAKAPASSTDKSAGSAPVDKNDADKKSEPAAQRFQIVRLQPKKSTRVVGNLKIASVREGEPGRIVRTVFHGIDLGKLVQTHAESGSGAGRIRGRGNAEQQGYESLHLGLWSESGCACKPDCMETDPDECPDGRRRASNAAEETQLIVSRPQAPIARPLPSPAKLLEPPDNRSPAHHVRFRCGRCCPLLHRRRTT